MNDQTVTVVSVECEMGSKDRTDRVGFGEVTLPHPVSPGDEYRLVPVGYSLADNPEAAIRAAKTMAEVEGQDWERLNSMARASLIRGAQRVLRAAENTE